MTTKEKFGLLTETRGNGKERNGIPRRLPSPESGEVSESLDKVGERKKSDDDGDDDVDDSDKETSTDQGAKRSSRNHVTASRVKKRFVYSSSSDNSSKSAKLRELRKRREPSKHKAKTRHSKHLSDDIDPHRSREKQHRHKSSRHLQNRRESHDEGKRRRKRKESLSSVEEDPYSDSSRHSHRHHHRRHHHSRRRPRRRSSSSSTSESSDSFLPRERGNRSRGRDYHYEERHPHHHERHRRRRAYSPSTDSVSTSSQDFHHSRKKRDRHRRDHHQRDDRKELSYSRNEGSHLPRSRHSRGTGDRFGSMKPSPSRSSATRGRGSTEYPEYPKNSQRAQCSYVPDSGRVSADNGAGQVPVAKKLVQKSREQPVGRAPHIQFSVQHKLGRGELQLMVCGDCPELGGSPDPEVVLGNGMKMEATENYRNRYETEFIKIESKQPGTEIAYSYYVVGTKNYELRECENLAAVTRHDRRGYRKLVLPRPTAPYGDEQKMFCVTDTNFNDLSQNARIELASTIHGRTDELDF